MRDFLRYCQIRLDFHTSEQLANIGGEFIAGAWGQMPAAAHVDSATRCARGHHGLIFLEIQARRKRRYPHLRRAQLEECGWCRKLSPAKLV